MRNALYMAACQYNPVIHEFYKCLISTATQKKVAVVACMLKLLTILNAIIRTGIPWQPDDAAVGRHIAA